jgi:hypothetical protein
MAVIRNRVRVGGSGFTIFTFAGQPIAFAQQVGYTSPAPVGPGAVAIHPMDEPNPVQVITPAAAGMGSLILNLYELYNEKVWDRLGMAAGFSAGGGATPPPVPGTTNTIGAILNGAVDITDIFIRIAEQNPADLSVVKYIRPPKIAGTQNDPYTEEYHNCVVTNVTDGEQIEIGTMEVIKQVTVGFTHVTRNGGRRSKAWDYRDNPL